MKSINTIIFVFVSFFLVSCNNLFDFSPYAADVDDALKNQTKINLNNLSGVQTKSSELFSFVTIADSHYKFKELRKAVEKINTIDDIDFVVHLGDMTDKGLMMEYEMFSKEIYYSSIPVFTCIGNHDYLSNGGSIYKQMFGAYNYTIEHKGIKMVFFDATVWESGKTPDMSWFEKELSSCDLPKIVFSHIPPWDDQYSDTNKNKYKDLIDTENVIISMHGHHHEFSDANPMNTETTFLIPGSIDNRNICKIEIFAR